MSEIVSFYSYKGGVGRSLTLANVAVLLARRGFRVACIDFDLEAGGLHTIFGIEARSIKHTLLDFLAVPGLPDIERGVLDLTSTLPHHCPEGRLYLLPTVSEVKRVNDALESRRDLPMLLGSVISQLENLCLPNFIFIDSRSGFAELAAATIRESERLVCVLRPNKQNMEGLRLLLDILDSIRRPPRTFLALSQVPEIHGVAERLRELELILGTRTFDAIIPFDPHLALDETVVTRAEPLPSFAHRYFPIADWLADRRTAK